MPSKDLMVYSKVYKTSLTLLWILSYKLSLSFIYQIHNLYRYQQGDMIGYISPSHPPFNLPLNLKPEISVYFQCKFSVRFQCKFSVRFQCKFSVRFQCKFSVRCQCKVSVRFQCIFSLEISVYFQS